MKIPSILITACMLLTGFINAQITITQNDFAGSGDTVVMSTGNIPSNLKYKPTGQDTIWNYSFLHSTGTQTDRFLPISSTSVIYAVYFINSGINNHRANMAQSGADLTPNSPYSLITINNVFNFYYKNSSKYTQPGFGAEINGIKTPIGFSHADVLYNFPVNYGDRDTSVSGYNLNIPTVGYYSHGQTRINYVDGWGKVITPLDTFPVLRMVTQIATSDSFYIDTLHYGIRNPTQIQKQYKWIANNQQEPVLQINTRILPIVNYEIVTGVLYRDTIKIVETGINETTPQQNFNIYPNPAAIQFTVFKQGITPNTILTITDINGKIVYTGNAIGNTQSIDVAGWAKGIYFVTLSNETGRQVNKVVIQ